jgi:hypothetical protein
MGAGGVGATKGRPEEGGTGWGCVEGEGAELMHNEDDEVGDRRSAASPLQSLREVKYERQNS